MAYATGADLVKRYDVDLIGDLATDDRESLDRAAVPTHPHVVAALEDASGEIDVALMCGGKYTPQQLAAMNTNTVAGYSRQHLIRVTCAIAMQLLFERRPGLRPEMAEAIGKQSRAHVEALRRGDNVFGISENLDAGTIHVETISAVEVDDLNLLPDRMPRYFPGSAQRTPGAR